MLARILPGASQLQNYHPLIVHFPIAFIYGASLSYLLAWISTSEKVQWAAFWVLLLAALSAGLALASGFYAESGLMVAESIRDQLVNHHKHLMVAASILTGVLALWALASRPMPIRARVLFMAGLVALMVLIAAGADLGGEMVYGYNAAGSACSQPIDFKK